MATMLEEIADGSAQWDALTRAVMWIQEERYHSDGFVWVSKLVKHPSELEFPRDFTKARPWENITV